jgi:peptide/nickel transport system ATP-binding protein
MGTLLTVDDLHVTYPARGGVVQAVSGVSFEQAEGEIIGIVGESGCGKSTMSRAILQSPPPNSGTVDFAGRELTSMSREAVRRLRPEMQMVFQDPISSLNPRHTVRHIVMEPLNIWRIGSKAERKAKADEMLGAVGLNPADYAHRRPSELSGGQCQRVAIARALVAGARLLVCDEPVSSLDVSLRATVLNLIEDLRAEFGIGVLFIAHDLAVVKSVADRIMVMYLGKVVEIGTSDELFSAPAHPYTQALLASIPQADPEQRLEPLSIEGDPPSPLNPPSGCRFRTRCPLVQDICSSQEPAMTSLGDTHQVACHFPTVPAGSHRGPEALAIGLEVSL